MMTIVAMEEHSDWQYLEEECQIVKLGFRKSQMDISEGRPLPAGCEKAPGSLQ